jgi:hypothetical protein
VGGKRRGENAGRVAPVVRDGARLEVEAAADYVADHPGLAVLARAFVPYFSPPTIIRIRVFEGGEVGEFWRFVVKSFCLAYVLCTIFRTPFPHHTHTHTHTAHHTRTGAVANTIVKGKIAVEGEPAQLLQAITEEGDLVHPLAMRKEHVCGKAGKVACGLDAAIAIRARRLLKHTAVHLNAHILSAVALIRLRKKG